MATYTIPQRFQHRRGTYTELYQRNEVLRPGEECFETHDADGVEHAPWKCKVGDGTTAWNDLEYESDVPASDNFADATPYYTETTFLAPEFKQVLFSEPIELAGDAVLDVEGLLIEVD